MAIICCDICDAQDVPGTRSVNFPGEPTVCYLCQGDEFDPYYEMEEMDHRAAAVAAPPSGHPGIREFLAATGAAVVHLAIVVALIGCAAVAVVARGEQHPPSCKAGSAPAMFTNCDVEQ